MSMVAPKSLVEDVMASVHLPWIYTKIRKLVDDESVSISALVEIVSQDPLLTESILQLANSSMFGFPEKIESVRHAVKMLDKTQLHDLVLTSTVLQLFHFFPNHLMDIDVFKRRSIYCGLVTRLLGSLFNSLDGERFFVVGLVHEIGHLVLFSQLPEMSTEIIMRAKASNQPMHEVERDLMGTDYAEIGAELMSAWQFPHCFQETTQYHLKPAEAKRFTMETAVLHIANHMMITAEPCGDCISQPPVIDPLAWEITGLTADVVLPISRFARFLAPPQPMFDTHASVLAPFAE